MIPFFKKVFNDFDFRHFGGFFPQNLTASVLSCYELLTSCKISTKKKLKSQFQSWFIRANRKSELVSQQEMTYYFQVSCVCACVRACVWRGGKRRGEHESWIQHVKQILRFSKGKRFSWNRIFSLLVFVL